MARRKNKAAAEGEDPTTVAEADTSGGLRLSDHPRARRQIDRAKGWGGLAGFGLGLLLASRTGLPMGDVVMRAVASGIVAYLVTWAVAVVVWRQLARAELDEMRRMLHAAYTEAEAEVERRRLERAAADGSTA